MSLRRTPLHALHRELGGRLVPFAGWEMPVQFAGVVSEHLAVRQQAGLFDVSHMGELRVTGPDALPLLQSLTPNDVSRLAPGRAHYSALTTDAGGFVDDIIVYRRGEESFLVVTNAANTARDLAWIRERGGAAAESVEDLSDETALLALQGPRAQAILQTLTDLDLATIRYYRFAEGEVAGVPGTVARMGYTGEDGFEIMVPADQAEGLARRLLEAGAPEGLVSTGLGARDTLRLEAKMALHGNDIDEDHSVEEADLGWIVKPDKGEFIGRDVLVSQRENGVSRKLVGFELRGRGVPRHGYPIVVNGEPFGEVTSGGYAPFLKKSLGLAYLPGDACEPGQAFEVVIRGRPVPAEVAPTPFYVRPGKKKKKKKKRAAAAAV
ncbi:MAG: glycine cleavage system aminomethyltransferase GcvT [Acidobacteria bacterium]|nr:glycine cleavage system aminomethyltransferase GcvT [Acidobacteriota bacterium]